MLAPWVAAMRWPTLVMSMVKPTSARQREVRRMVSEKIRAAQSGTLAASARFAAPPGALAEAALRPAAQTVAANARRLAKRKKI